MVEMQFPTDPNIQLRGLAPIPYRKSLDYGSMSFAVTPVTRSGDFQVRAKDAQLTGTNYSTDTIAGLQVDANTAVALQVLVPPEQPDEGGLTGKTAAAPGPLTAGSHYTVTVRAVDQYWNRANSGRQVKLSANDIYAVVPSAQPLGAGEYAFADFVPSASTGNLTVTAADDSGSLPALTAQTDSDITVAPAAPTNLIVALPNESRVPGKTAAPFGVDGRVFVATAGVAFMPSVFATDANYNWITGVDQTPIRIFTDDPAIAGGILGDFGMNNGSFTFTSPGKILYTAGARTLYAHDQDGNPPNLANSGLRSVILNPNTPNKLRTLLPTCPPPATCAPETRLPGPTGNGRVPAPLTTAAGQPVTITVDITDSFWNLTPGTSQEIRLVSDDPFAVIVPTTQVVTASGTYSVTFKRAGVSYVWSEMAKEPPAFGPSLAKDTATVVNVTAGPAKRLLVKLPGESFDQGSATGKSGTPNPPVVAGTVFSVNVGLVDDFFNLVTGTMTDVSLRTPSDSFAPYISTKAINPAVGYTDSMPVALRRAATGHYLLAREYVSVIGVSDDPQSSTFTVLAGAPMGLQLVMPGQTAQPGSGDYPNGGVSGSISTPTAGTPFKVTVNLVDRYMNVYPDAGAWPHVYVNTSDEYDLDSATQPLASGSLPVTLTMVTKTTTAVVGVYPEEQVADKVCTGNVPTNVCMSANLAARTPQFKVFASTAAKLQVLLPGESLVPGKCDYLPGVVCRNLGASEGAPGKSGTPANFQITASPTSMQADVYLLDKFWNPVSDLVAGNPGQDTNPPAVMPKVKLRTPSDPLAASVGAEVLSYMGSWSFQVSPLTALSTYTIVAATTSDSAVEFSSAVSAQFWVLPGPAHHMHFSDVPVSVTAGTKFSVGLSVHDQFHNQLSTGPNAYRGTVQFIAEPFSGNQSYSFNPPTVQFSSSVDQGYKTLTDLVTLRKAGTCPVGGASGGRWIKAYDLAASIVTSEVAAYSQQPCITVVPGAPDAVKVYPLEYTEVSAGGIVTAGAGYQQFTGQLTDAFDNSIVNAQDIKVEVTEVVGIPGHLAWDDGGTLVELGVGVSTQVATDAQGRIGYSNKLYYYVSSKAGDSARIWVGTQTAPADLTLYKNSQKNISGPLVTVGGEPSRLVFISSPTHAVVGINEVAGGGAQFVLERRDDFNNVTRRGDELVTLKVAEEAIHSANLRTLGIASNNGDYGFRLNDNSAFITAIQIYDKFTGAETPFRFHDRLSSYSGQSPAANTGEGGRPGKWTLQAFVGTTMLASHQIQLDPDVTVKVNFANAQNAMVAGKTVDFVNNRAVFRAQLQDQFDNPVVATQTYTVNLSTVVRWDSRLNDYVAFSTAPDQAVGSRSNAPYFTLSTKTVDIPLDSYQATFYYMDTTASNRYPSGGLKPVIGLSVNGLFSAVQSVDVLPDSIDRAAVSQGAGQALKAGTTSQAFILETRDYYGNASPLRPGQDMGRGYVLFEVASNSPGQVQVSTPDANNFGLAPYNVYLPLGQSATSFMLMDTLLSHPTWLLTISGVTYPTWEATTASYTVTPGPPAGLVWGTSSRRLIAGTTVQFQGAITTDTVIAASLVDRFGNVTDSTQTFNVRYSATHDSAWGGIDPNAVILATQPSAAWKTIGPGNYIDVDIPGNSGLTRAPMYMFDTVAGTVTVSARTMLGGIPVFATIYQDHYITPGQGRYITLHHPYTEANPLRVTVPGTLTRMEGAEQIGVTVRDLFGNIAKGDAVNGQYYTGVVNFWSSGSSGTVSLRDPIAGTTYHMFTPAEHGSFNNLRVVDALQETLIIAATDYSDNSIWGITSDGARLGLPADPAKRSDGNVNLAGVVVIPNDMAPESNPPPNGPIPAAKIALRVIKKVLNQGDGNVPASPSPIPMLRLNMRIHPTGSVLDASLAGLRVNSRPEGNLDNSHINEVAVYKDGNNNGTFDPAEDLFISTGLYRPTEGAWFFGNPAYGQLPLNVDKPGPCALVSGGGEHYFFVTVRLSSSGYAVGELPASFGLEMPNPAYITLSDDSQVGVAVNNFGIKTTTSSVEREPATIRLTDDPAVYDINAWWQPFGAPAPAVLPYVSQGETNVGVLKLAMWTDVFTAVLSRIKVTHTGSGGDKDITKVRLYLDTQANKQPPGDGAFQFAVDKQVAEASFPPGETRAATLTILDPSGVNGTIGTSTHTYFLAVDYSPSAEANQKHGFIITASDLSPLPGNGTIGNIAPLISTEVVVQATPDIVRIIGVNDLGQDAITGELQESVPSKVIQNDVNKPVMKLSMKVEEGSAEWKGLKIDRWMASTWNSGTRQYNQLFALHNKASDVSNVRVWMDRNGDGLLNTSTDTQVSPFSGDHVFLTSNLSVALSSAGVSSMTVTDIVVDNINGMFPADDPFVNDPANDYNRLVLGDDQTDERKKEIVICTALDRSAGIFHNCLRAQEDTAPLAFSTGTVLSGSAHIPIMGLIGGGGQIISTDKQDYFITYDIDAQATVSPSANIGVIIGSRREVQGPAEVILPNTGYFLIRSPKHMDDSATTKVGVPVLSATGKTVSLVSNLAEISDKIRIVSTNAVDGPLGPFAQQQSTVAVAMFTIQADVSDALWRWLLVFATGTAAAAGNISSDVDLVSMWYDLNGDGIFNPGALPVGDVLVGSGTFGNYAGLPLVAQVNLNSPVTVTIPARAPIIQRYFVAYHISAGAMPVDAVTAKPRTLGVELRPPTAGLGSLPSGAVPDDVRYNAVSYPNVYDTSSPLPFSSKERAIIPSPQTFFVKSTPYFSNSSGTFPSPTLDPGGSPVPAAAVGAVDPFWIVSSTAGLVAPSANTTAYMMIEGEIVQYEALHATMPRLLGVHRGQLNSVPAAHSSGTVLGTMIRQGESNLALLRMEVWSSAFQVQWSSLKLSRILPSGLYGEDADIRTVRLYKSVTPDGAYHRDAATGINVGDLELGAVAFGVPPDTDGRATLPVSDPSLGYPGYTLITPTTQVFYLAADISPSAKFSHPQLNPPNEVFGVAAADAGKFTLTPSNAGHVAVIVTPAASPNYPIMPTINKVTVEFDQVSGNSAYQNQKNVPMLRLRLRTDQNSAIVQKIRVDRVGSAAALDSDITLVKIWRDINDNGVFDVIDATRTPDGFYPNLLSYGNETFSSGTVNISLRTSILVTTSPVDYFATYDVSQFAAEGNRFGLAMMDPGYMTLQVPNTVLFTTASFVSNPLVQVKKVTSQVGLGVNNISADIAGVTQAQQNVPMLRFNLATDIALAPWRSLRLERTGGSPQDPSKPLGRNTNVKFIRVFKDINQDDELTKEDVNISEVDTSLVVSVSSGDVPPFDMVVMSTAGFPLDNSGVPIGGQLLVNGAELMTFSGPGCLGAAVPGVDLGTGRPCLQITSRGDLLGQGPTPRLNVPAGGPVRKVDVYDQGNDSNVQALVTLKNDQFVSPTAATFFVAYDIGDSAVQNDLVGLAIRDASWIGMPRGDTVMPQIHFGVSRTAPLGTYTTGYPYVGTDVAISPIVLSVFGFTVAPSGAGQGQVYVPLLQLELKTNSDFVNIGAMRFGQTGTILSTTTAGVGDGDFSKVSVWLDNGDMVFSPQTDTLLGSTAPALGFVSVPLAKGGIPYLRVSTGTARLFVSADIGYTDKNGGSTLNHEAGLILAHFSDLVAPNGAPVSAAADMNKRPPYESRTVTVMPLTVPAVAISSSGVPVIVTRAQAGVPGQAVGYPAYARVDHINCNNGHDGNNQRNNICRDGQGNPIPDQGKWLCADGRSWLANCVNDPPLLDINGDGVPDNFRIGESSRATCVSLVGDGIPARDMTNTGILDMDMNQDGIVDMVFSNGFGGFQIMLGNDVTDQGNAAKATPVPDQGFVPSAWTAKSGELLAMLPMVDATGYYQVAVGEYYDNPTSFSGLWSSVTFLNVGGLSARGYSTLAAPATSAKIGNLTIPIPGVTRLTQALTPDTTSFTVENASQLSLPGIIFVGSEILRADKINNTTLRVVALEGDPSPGTGRALRGSAPIVHLSGEPISDRAAILFARFVSVSGSSEAVSAARPILFYRPDPSAPTSPGAVQPLEQGKPAYAVRWNAAAQPYSGVLAYEVQERGGDPKNLADTVIWRTLNIINGKIPSYTVGDPKFPGETPRPGGQFYAYRVRAISGAGVFSIWSPLGVSVNTGISASIIAGVSNYPNPFDTRKGGAAGKTTITYVLAADSDITITIYDLLGYVVKTITCATGGTGGKAGPNFVEWDGRNGSGMLVSKGGYIARIKVKSPNGSSTVIRKIGVIH
ncbi:MAG: hypothetical protein WC881_00605 [Elusimicrobiota bacterium]